MAINNRYWSKSRLQIITVFFFYKIKIKMMRIIQAFCLVFLFFLFFFKG